MLGRSKSELLPTPLTNETPLRLRIDAPDLREKHPDCEANRRLHGVLHRRGVGPN